MWLAGGLVSYLVSQPRDDERAVLRFPNDVWTTKNVELLVKVDAAVFGSFLQYFCVFCRILCFHCLSELLPFPLNFTWKNVFINKYNIPMFLFLNSQRFKAINHDQSPSGQLKPFHISIFLSFHASSNGVEGHWDVFILQSLLPTTLVVRSSGEGEPHWSKIEKSN